MVAGRAYESDDTRRTAADLGYTPMVPPKRNRTKPWSYDRWLYEKRNEIERHSYFTEAPVTGVSV